MAVINYWSTFCLLFCTENIHNIHLCVYCRTFKKVHILKTNRELECTLSSWQSYISHFCQIRLLGYVTSLLDLFFHLSTSVGLNLYAHNRRGYPNDRGHSSEAFLSSDVIKKTRSVTQGIFYVLKGLHGISLFMFQNTIFPRHWYLITKKTGFINKSVISGMCALKSIDIHVC